MTHPLYEVWFSRGEGLMCGAKFRLFEDAQRYVVAHQGDASYAIRSPDGHWDTYKRVRPPGPRSRLARGTGR